MRWRRRRRPECRPPISADPVGAAVAAVSGPLIPRHPEVTPELADLPQWIEVSASDEVEGFNTHVWLNDEINDYCDPYENGLDQALADQPGIEEVLAEDREVVYLRTSLALADVMAAVIRSVVEVNRAPRAPAPTGKLSDERIEELATAVRPVLEEAGFAATKGGSRYFYREGGDGFVQSVAFAPGIGWAAPSAPDLVAPAHCGLSSSQWVAPSAAALWLVVDDDVLPVLAATRDRRDLATWVGADATRADRPMDLPQYARLFAQWGFVDAAALVLAHLEREWASMRDHSDVVEASRLIRAHG